MGNYAYALQKVYNQSLVSMLIHELGIDKTKEVLKGWVDNNVKIFSSDTNLIKAITAGHVTCGIVNTYYLARLQKKDKKLSRENLLAKPRFIWGSRKR